MQLHPYSRADRAGSAALIEPLEGRQFLSVNIVIHSGGTGTNLINHSVTLPTRDLTGAYAGKLIMAGRQSRLAALSIANQVGNLIVDGTLSISGFRTFTVTGSTTGNRFTLRLTSSLGNGTWKGKLLHAGTELLGTVNVVGGERIRGVLDVVQSAVAIPPAVQPGFIGNNFNTLFNTFRPTFGPVNNIGRSFFADFFTDPTNPAVTPVGSVFDTRFAPTFGNIGVPQFAPEPIVFTPNPVFGNLFATTPFTPLVAGPSTSIGVNPFAVPSPGFQFATGSSFGSMIF